MAIVQISRITNRKGLQENLPQLAGAELGWSIDDRRLFIGNGTLEEGAPVIGNTEVLTEFSDILGFNATYTYQGAAAGYTVQTGATSGSPVTQSLQSWLDQFASVKDFGAVGDGITDDTAAINRALYQLYCREVNPQIRRGLFFPAGVYLVTSTILIPPYAFLEGEGANASIIKDIQSNDSTSLGHVARTTDSLQQTGAQIGSNGAVIPQYITCARMAFESTDAYTDIFLVEDANNCRFESVRFSGPLTTTNLTTSANNTAGVRLVSTTSFICEEIVFDQCYFGGTTYGIDTDYQVKGVVVGRSRLDTLYQGVLLGAGTPVNGGPTGVRIVENLFDNIYAEGVVIGVVSLNATGYNIFYDVANHFNGTISPATYIINISGNNNICVGDMFERADAFATGVYKRIYLNSTNSIGFVNSSRILIGSETTQPGPLVTLTNNSSGTAFTLSSNTFVVEYNIVRNITSRMGVMTVGAVASAGLTVNDSYTENATTGIVLSAVQAGASVNITYTSTNTGVDAIMYYTVKFFN